MTTEEKHCVSCGLFLREGLSDEGLCLVKRVVRSCADICDYDEDAEFMDITPHDEKFTVGTCGECLREHCLMRSPEIMGCSVCLKKGWEGK